MGALNGERLATVIVSVIAYSRSLITKTYEEDFLYEDFLLQCAKHNIR